MVNRLGYRKVDRITSRLMETNPDLIDIVVKDEIARGNSKKVAKIIYDNNVPINEESIVALLNHNPKLVKFLIRFIFHPRIYENPNFTDEAIDSIIANTYAQPPLSLIVDYLKRPKITYKSNLKITPDLISLINVDYNTANNIYHLAKNVEVSRDAIIILIDKFTLHMSRPNSNKKCCKLLKRLKKLL